MKILMFGWEFPPHIAGGLGTACFGLTKGMMKQGMDVIFVVPKAYGDESQEAVRLVNASDVAVDLRYAKLTEYWKQLTFIEIGSNLIPYVGEDEYYTMLNEQEKETEYREDSIYKRKYQFSGKYGKNLMDEVARYAIVAGAIAKNETFDVIHAHDWLTLSCRNCRKAVFGQAFGCSCSCYGIRPVGIKYQFGGVQHRTEWYGGR